MGRRFDTYGFAGPLEPVARRIEQLLGLKFEERDSSYYAGTYYLYRERTYGRSLQLYNNYDSVGGFWIREQYRDHALIAEVSELDGMDDIQKKLLTGVEGAVLLRSRTLPDEPSDEE